MTEIRRRVCFLLQSPIGSSVQPGLAVKAGAGAPVSAGMRFAQYLVEIKLITPIQERLVVAEELIDELDELGEAEGKPAGKKKKWLIISLLTILLLGGAAAAAVYYVVVIEGEAGVAAGADGEETSSKPEGPPIYVPIQEPFIVNLAEQPSRFLQVSIELVTRNNKVIDAVETHMPVIRNNLLILFSSQTLEEISTREGKEKLRQQAVDEIRKVLSDRSEPSGVDNILFTSLVVQ